MQSTSSKKIIVAGGGGFIGKPLCRALLAKGYQVTILTRGPDKRASGVPDGPLPAYRHWDGKSGAGWEDLADGAFALVNLAGESVAERKWNAQQKERILQSRQWAGQAMVDAVRRTRVKPLALVQASASGYYGHTGEKPVDESSPVGQGFLAEVATVWEASTTPVEALGVRRAVVRTGLVLGRTGGMLPKILKPFQMFVGGPLGRGAQGFPWIHLEDEVGAIVFLIENQAAQGPFNLAAPQSVSNLDFCRALAKTLGRPCGLAVPAFALKLLFGEMAEELFLSGCRMFPRRLLELGFDFRHPQLVGALRNLLGQEAR